MQFYRGAACRIAGRWRGRLRTAAASAAGLLFPPHCAACRGEIEKAGEVLLCSTCRESLLEQRRVPCPRCAAPLPEQLRQARDRVHCRTEKFAFSSVTALGAYESSLRQAVLELKRPGAEPLTMALGGALADCIGSRGPLPDVAAPIPTHWLRRFGQRVNAAELLAETAAARLRVAVWPHLLAVCRLRRRQHLLTPTERRHNMRGAFRLKAGYDVAGARVLIIDDVLTTGATAHAAAKVLKQAGAAEVTVAVVARGIGV
jgi:ComF family protein